MKIAVGLAGGTLAGGALAAGPCGGGAVPVPDRMDCKDITAWALANGWQLIAGAPSLTKPSSPKEAIVRLIFKTTVVSLEVKKPAGKWEKISSAAYGSVQPDPETNWPMGLGFEKIPSFSMLMRDNKDRQTFSKFT